MWRERTLRALAVAVAVVAAAGIVSAGIVANPVWADAALERAAVVDSPDARRAVASTSAAPAVPLASEPSAPPAPAAPAPSPAPVVEPAPVPAPVPARPAVDRAGSRDAGCEASMLRWMNETRAAAGRPALTWDDAILNVAVDWSHEMAARSELGHNPGYGERVFAARAEAMTAAENVGWGLDSTRAVYDEFLRSPSHRDKILSGSLTHTAVACVRDGAGEVWVTVNFWG